MDINQTEIFCNIGRALTSSLNPNEVFSRVMTFIGEYFSPRNWSLLLMEEATERLKFEIAMGADSTRMKDIYIEKGEGIVGWVCQHGKPIVVEDAQNDFRFSPRMDEVLGFTTRSVVCVPLLNGNNRVVGAIELINKIVPPSAKFSSTEPSEVIPSDETFTPEDMMILSAIGSFTGVAAENAFLHQKVRELSMIDSLTGIHNRHYFNEMFHRESERVRRYHHTMCMLMIDVDDFKQVNDSFGHLVGDQVLGAISGILKAAVRESDVLARYGGDEFVVLMPLAGEHEGRNVAGRIQDLVSQWNKKKTIPGVSISLSIGVDAAGPDDVGEILKNADNDLYRNKNFRKKAEELISEEEMRYYFWNNLFADGD